MIRSHKVRQLLGMVLFCVVLWPIGIRNRSGADEPKTVDSSESAIVSRRARMKELANSYSFKVPNTTEPVNLIEKPLFSWATPERQAIGGEMYLWTLEGRPFASIGIWTYDDTRDSHELQSLTRTEFQASTSATTPNVAASARSSPWQPRTAGVEYRKLEGAEAPGNTPVRRMAQAKSILRERFSANITRDNGGSEELRLLSQPLFRYQSPLPSGVIDGAMFAFVMGTDPEVLVILEARAEGDTTAWYYAVAPATSVVAKCSIDRSEVWKNEKQSVNATFRLYMNR